MKVAHVRERHAPAGAPWRLAAALDPGESPGRWLDLEVARRRAVSARPALAHDSTLHRQPVTTLDDHLARGLRVDALRDLVEGFEPRGDDDDAVLAAGELVFGPPILRPPSLRDFYAFEGHVRTMWERRGGEVPEAWYRLPIFYFSNVSEIRGPDEPVWCPAASHELDYELEVAALVDTPARRPGARARRGGDRRLHDLRRLVGPRPPARRDRRPARPGQGQGLRELVRAVAGDAGRAGGCARRGTGYDLAMTAEVNGSETSRGRWSDAQFSFGEMLARASADARLRPGDLIGSGTVGTGCLLEVREATLGRYLEPGDEVVLRVERLGALRTPIVARPG